MTGTKVALKDNTNLAIQQSMRILIRRYAENKSLPNLFWTLFDHTAEHFLDEFVEVTLAETTPKQQLKICDRINIVKEVRARAAIRILGDKNGVWAEDPERLVNWVRQLDNEFKPEILGWLHDHRHAAYEEYMRDE